MYDSIDKDYSDRDYSTGVPRYEVGRITQLTEPHKSKALEIVSQGHEASKFADEFFDERAEYFRASLESTTEHPLQQVFNDVIAQVASGKGQERHGGGKEFMEQPWVRYCDVSGVGFAVGQALKKMEEAQKFEEFDRWEREMLGAIAYAAMAVLYRRKENRDACEEL